MTLAEIVMVGILFDWTIILLVWYLDNVLPIGPGICRPLCFPFMVRKANQDTSDLSIGLSILLLTQASYWIPGMTFVRAPERPSEEKINFEPDPRDQLVAIELVQVSKVRSDINVR